MKKMLFALTLAVSLFACKKDKEPTVAGIFKSAPSTFQHGKSWTWIEMDAQNKPLKIGITIDAAAMNTLDTSRHGNGGHSHDNSISMAIPIRSTEVPFKHIMLDWNPHGHEPAGIYDLPHFDFHFYTTSEAERLAIPVYEADSLKFKNFPQPAYLPNLYFPIPGGIPQMGTHWIDVTSGELNGQVFTQTFIFGTYNGKVTFYEPMITKAFIDASPNFSRAIPVPQKFQESGYYPTKMKLQKVGGSVQVTLEDFVYRTQS